LLDSVDHTPDWRIDFGDRLVGLDLGNDFTGRDSVAHRLQPSDQFRR
jgi:hypothetical protein